MATATDLSRDAFLAVRDAIWRAVSVTADNPNPESFDSVDDVWHYVAALYYRLPELESFPQWRWLCAKSHREWRRFVAGCIPEEIDFDVDPDECQSCGAVRLTHNVDGLDECRPCLRAGGVPMVECPDCDHGELPCTACGGSGCGRHGARPDDICGQTVCQRCCGSGTVVCDRCDGEGEVEAVYCDCENGCDECDLTGFVATY